MNKLANDYAVRANLVNRGIADSDIGYDPNSGQVQIKGQNFMKPEMNVMGTTYTSQDNFNNAFKQYNKQQEANQLQQSTADLTQRVNQGPAANPYNDQITKMIQDVMSKMNAPQQDVYSTPQYAAAQAQQQRAAHQGIRSAQEALGSAGFGRSTALGESANRVQNDANEYLQLQLVPQIQQQLAAQRQAEIANQMSLFNPVFNQLNRQDTLERNKNEDLLNLITLLQGNEQTDFNNNITLNQDRRADQDQAFKESSLTGNFDKYANEKKQMADNSAAWFNASPAEKARLAAENEMIGATIGAKRDAKGNWQYPQASRTLEGSQFDKSVETDERNFEYQKARDAIADKQYQQKFDEDVRRYGLDYALQKAVQMGQLSISQQNANTSAFSASNSAVNANFSKLMDIWQTTGKAPAGLESLGVQAGQTSASGDPDSLDNRYKQAQIDSLNGKTNTPKATSYKDDPDFMEEVSQIMQNPTTAMNILRQNSGSYIAKYGLAGYKELISLSQK